MEDELKQFLSSMENRLREQIRENLREPIEDISNNFEALAQDIKHKALNTANETD